MYGTPLNYISCGSSQLLTAASYPSRIITIGNDLSITDNRQLTLNSVPMSEAITAKKEETNPNIKITDITNITDDYRKTILKNLSTIKMDPPELMTIVCPDGSITVLFDIISANCSYFGALKNHSMEETKSGKINIQKPIKIIRAIINFIYAFDIDVIEKFSLKDLGETYDLARMWTIDKLEEIIINIVKNRATIANCLEIFELGVEFQSEELEEIGQRSFIDYIAFNARPTCVRIDKILRRCCIHNFSDKVYPGSCCDYYLKGEEQPNKKGTTLGCCRHNPSKEEEQFVVNQEKTESLIAALQKMSNTNRTRLLFNMLP